LIAGGPGNNYDINEEIKEDEKNTQKYEKLINKKLDELYERKGYSDSI